MADKETDERDRGLHRHGTPDPAKWDEQKAVADRPNDEPEPNSTFADRAKRAKTRTKQVAEVEDKQVAGAQTKTSARRARRG